MPGLAAGHRDRDVAQGVSLGEGEVLDAGGGPFEDGPLLGGEPGQGFRENIATYDERVAGAELSEIAGVPAKRILAAPPHVIDDRGRLAQRALVDRLASQLLDLIGLQPAQDHFRASPRPKVRDPSRRVTARARRSSSRATSSSRNPSAASLTSVK